MADTHPVPPSGTLSAADIAEGVLRPILSIRGLTRADAELVERLLDETQRSAAQFDPWPPAGPQLDLFIERMQRILSAASEVMSKYSD